MEDEIKSAPEIEAEVEVVPRRDDLFLVARNQLELQSCQAKMALWFREQILVCKRNEHDLREALETAKRNKWQATTHQKQLNDSLDRKVWLVKCLKAIEAGYAIIPDMPADVFAVRVLENSNRLKSNPDASLPRFLPNVGHSNLPEGEGKYVSNRPKAKRNYADKRFYVKSLRPVHFPVVAARTQIMQATESALALKVFDEVGIAPQTKRPDPMILGRIYKPGDSNTHLTFIICWFLDLESI